jgi:hypothetical protein
MTSLLTNSFRIQDQERLLVSCNGEMARNFGEIIVNLLLLRIAFPLALLTLNSLLESLARSHKIRTAWERIQHIVFVGPATYLSVTDDGAFKNGEASLLSQQKDTTRIPENTLKIIVTAYKF